MRRSVLLLLFGVVLPGSFSHVLFLRFRHEPRPVEGRLLRAAPPVEVRVVEALPPPLAWEDRACQVHAERSRTLSAAASDRLEIRAGAGSLQVRGTRGAEAVRVRALLCASDVERLAAMELELRRVMGPDLLLETRQPDPDGELGWSDDEYARIDLVVEVPLGMAATITDGSGPLTAIGLGDVTIQDGEGEIELTGGLGDVTIADGSGSVRLTGIDGNVEVRGGSGSIAIEGVSGSVVVTEGSGPMEIAAVSGDVRVPEDAASPVSVSRVGGDLVVEGFGVGAVRPEGVRGRVLATGGRAAPARRAGRPATPAPPASAPARWSGRGRRDRASRLPGGA